jgi:hypothetical protein
VYEANQQTLRMASFCIEGNSIDHSWYSIIKNESGLTDGNAILLLADIVYWYRPSYQVDPKTGEAKIGKKFKSDILQRSYIDIEKQFGFTKRQAQEAFKTLETLDICHRELRTVEINGVKVSNILFIRLNDSKLAYLREKYYKNTEELKNCISSYENCHEGMTKLSQAHDKIVTYTENTTKTTTETTTSSIKDVDELIFSDSEKEHLKSFSQDQILKAFEVTKQLCNNKSNKSMARYFFKVLEGDKHAASKKRSNNPEPEILDKSGKPKFEAGRTLRF